MGGVSAENFDQLIKDLNHRVWEDGLPAYISPRLAVRYAPRETLNGLFKQLSRYGYGRYRFISKHPDAISIGQMIPPGFVAWLIVTSTLAFFVPWARYLIFATLAVYFAAIIGFSITLASRHGAKFLWSGVLIYPTIHFGLGLGFWKGVFFRRQTDKSVAAASSGAM